jgi:hypothetical protein
MPYLGDAPSNPVPITLSSGSALVEAAGVADPDRHACWFSLPAQAAGQSVQLTPYADGVPTANYEVVMIWNGGNTAYYLNTDPFGYYSSVRASMILPLPDATPVLIGILPKNSATAPPFARVSVTGEPGVGAALNVAGWEALLLPDLTKRLKPDTELNVVVAATATPAGTPANPAVVDLTSVATPVAVDLSAYHYPQFHALVTVPAGYGVECVQTGFESQPPELTCDAATAVIDGKFNSLVNASRTFVIAPATPTLITVTPTTGFPTGGLTFKRVRISSVAGTPTDVDGASAEPCNALLFRLQDAVRAAQAPSGSFSIPNVPQGDYVLAVFSQADGRDIQATNLLIPQGERVAGGGYPF